MFLFILFIIDESRFFDNEKLFPKAKFKFIFLPRTQLKSIYKITDFYEPLFHTAVRNIC